MGSSDMHTVKAFLEAEAYDGPSLIIAYSHCIAHGYDLSFGMEQQKVAVSSGYWPSCATTPSWWPQGKNPFLLDSRPPSTSFKDYAIRKPVHHARQEQSEKLRDCWVWRRGLAAHWRLYDTWPTSCCERG